jgi:hypothetical protein
MGTGGSSAGTGMNKADDAAGKHGEKGRANAREKQEEHKR